MNWKKISLLSLFAPLFFLTLKPTSTKKLLAWPEEKNLCSYLEKMSSPEKAPSLWKLFKLRKVRFCGSFDIPKEVPPWLEKEKLKSLLHVETLEERKVLLYKKLIKKERRKKKRIFLIEEALKIKKDKGLTRLLRKLSPRKKPHPKTHEYLKVARDFRRNLEFDEAIFYYKKIIQGRFSLRVKRKAYDGIIRTFRMKQRRDLSLLWKKKKFQFIFSRYKKNKNSPFFQKLYYDAGLSLAIYYWNLEKSDKALRTLQKIIKKDLHFAPSKAHFVSGLIFEEKDRLQKAISFFDEALKDEEISQELEQKVLWKKAWVLKRQKKSKPSLETFRELTKKYPELRHLYWKARALEDLHEVSEAQKIYKKIILQDSYSYYGALSHKRLGQRLKRPPRKIIGLKSFFLPPLDKKERKSLKILKNLYSLKEVELIEEYLRYVKKLSHWHRFLFYLESGHFLKAFYTYKRLPSFEKDYVSFQKTRWLYPEPFKPLVFSFAQKNGVKPSFIYAIMRQESGFYSRATSSMGAYGLMQLLPQKARELNFQAKIPEFKKEDLFKPKININLGSFLLKSLLKIYNDSYIFTAIVYNAGEKPLNKWLKNFHGDDPTEFVENIPYTETRIYVKLVIRNLIFYELLFSPYPRMKFPDEILKSI